MKLCFVVGVALLAVTSFVFGNSSEEILDKVKSKSLKQLIKRNQDKIHIGLEKLEEKCPGINEKLKSALKEFDQCDDKIDDSLTICAIIQKYTLNCTKPLLNVIEGCLPEKARDLPVFAVESLLSLADYLCKQTGESIFELISPCLWETVEFKKNDECEIKLKKNFADYIDGDEIPSKSQVCSTLTDSKSCFQKHIEFCQAQKTKDVAVGAYDALIAPCSHIMRIKK